MANQDSTSTKKNILKDAKNLTIWEALIPVVTLVAMLFYNVFYVFGDDALSGSNQFILLLGAANAPTKSKIKSAPVVDFTFSATISNMYLYFTFLKPPIIAATAAPNKRIN